MTLAKLTVDTAAMKRANWLQSFLCGRASRVEQFASGSSSRDSLHAFKRRLKSHFFSLCFND